MLSRCDLRSVQMHVHIPLPTRVCMSAAWAVSAREARLLCSKWADRPPLCGKTSLVSLDAQNFLFWEAICKEMWEGEMLWLLIWTGGEKTPLNKICVFTLPIILLLTLFLQSQASKFLILWRRHRLGWTRIGLKASEEKQLNQLVGWMSNQNPF